MKKGQTLRGEIKKLQGGPKQYKQGWAEFYKLKFYLTPDVLIPRPETELIVDSVLQIANNHKPSSISIIDIGTGSGCIAISIAKNLPNAKIIATDISPAALDVAKKNAKFHKVEDQIFFIESDLLLALHLEGVASKLPDIIVANLPYIPTARLMYVVDPLVRDFEPRIALDGGRDGFDLYRKLFAQISLQPSRLMPKYLICEIDDSQAETAIAEAKRYFLNAEIELKKDLVKKDRLLIIKFDNPIVE